MNREKHQEILARWDTDKKKWFKTDAKKEDQKKGIFWVSPMDLEGFDLE